MKPIDLSGLIKGLMVVIGIALVMGKLDVLERWAVQESLRTFSKEPAYTILRPK